MRATEFIVETAMMDLSPQTIHKLADRKGVKWDNEPSFLKLTKQLTGKEHLDDLDQAGLNKVKRHLDGLQGVVDDYSNTTFNVDRRKLNVPALIQKGAILVTHPHGEQGWETDNKEDWAFSLISLYNVLYGGWPSEAKKYLKPQSYIRAEQQINSSAPNLGSDKLVYDGKYNQILWSIKQLGIPDNVAFLDKDKQGVAEGYSNAVTFFRGEPILSQERLNQLKSSIGKPYPILRKEGSAANIGTYMSPDGDKATSFVKQALAGQGKGGVVTQIQVNPNSFSKGDGGIDEAVIITNIAGLVSNQTPNKNDPLRIQDRKQAMLKYLGPGVKKYLNDPLLSDPKIVQSWYNPEFAQKNWNTINSGKQAVTKPGESNTQERMIRVLGPLAENIRRDPEVISYFISHNPGDWVEYNFRMNSDGSGTKVVDVKYYPPAKQGVAEGMK